MFYPEIPTRLATMSRNPLPKGVISAAQVDAVRLLTDPETFGGRAPTYFDTVVSHLVVDRRDLFILRKPLDHDGFKCATVEDRWNWCETQCMRGFSRLGSAVADCQARTQALPRRTRKYSRLGAQDYV